ncbi:PIN domain-containing protein [Pseudomonas solani]|uniref:PIN domain-containing protein n=1 Tax=Pseudomonas solani TaxID=2731552 RepID=UPI003F4ACFF6
MRTLNVFIDTNIFLNFYSFSDDKLEILDELIELSAPDKITIHLPKQVENELKRNRESKLQTAMSDFKKAQISTGIPHHMRGTETAKQYDDAVKSAEQAKRLLIANAVSLALRNELEVDQKLSRLFERSRRHAEDDDLYQKALVRMNKGNPPGKVQSIGDRYIWETLLAHVPNGDFFIISKDGDYTSPLTMDKTSRPLAYLSDEWTEKKQGGRLTIFRTINEILDYYKNLQNQPEINNPVPPIQPPPEARQVAEPVLDQIPNAPIVELGNIAPQPIPVVPRHQIEQAVNNLAESESFATTHLAIANINNLLAHLTKEDAELLFKAALDNSQIRWIISDEDVNDFYLSLVNQRVTEVDPELADSIIELLGLLPEKPESVSI